MKKSTKLAIVSTAIVVVFIVLDQLLKIWVKTNMIPGETIPLLGNWFMLHFIENKGMAFGLSFGENLGKLFLSLFRVIVVGAIIVYMIKRIKKDKMDMVATCLLSLVIAGAVGNIIDSAFYGMIFDYAPFMYGSVVDMFYVKLFLIPERVPGFGGDYFFPAIFNLADSCVTVGLFGMLFCYKHFVDNDSKDVIS